MPTILWRWVHGLYGGCVPSLAYIADHRPKPSDLQRYVMPFEHVGGSSWR